MQAVTSTSDEDMRERLTQHGAMATEGKEGGGAEGGGGLSGEGLS